MTKLDFTDLPKPINSKTDWPWISKQNPKYDSKKYLPKISIITPSYNQGHYLEESIRSVLLQSYPNLEHIIIDGGSTDNSVDIIKKYELWLTYWVSEKDDGQSDAINKGFAKATGDILGWLNSDDVLEENALIKIAEYFIKPEQQIWVIGCCKTIDDKGNQIGLREVRQPTFFDMINWTVKWFPQQSTFWSRGMWDKCGPLDIQLNYTMDYDLWLRMLEINKPIISSEIFSSYRFHDNAKCSTNVDIENIHKEIYQIWLKKTRFLNQLPYKPKKNKFMHTIKMIIAIPYLKFYYPRLFINKLIFQTKHKIVATFPILKIFVKHIFKYN